MSFSPLFSDSLKTNDFYKLVLASKSKICIANNVVQLTNK